MYSDEIKRMLEENNNVISREEYAKAFDPNISTQLSYIAYDDKNQTFLAKTKDNFTFFFTISQEKKSVVKVKKV